MPDERVVSTRAVYNGKIINVRVDTVRMLKHGRPVDATREIVEHAPAVVIVPVDAGGHVLMVRQYRLAARQELVECPAGGVEPGEAPDSAVQRELQEETGFAAEQVTKLGSFFLAPGWSTEEMHAYLARGLRHSRREADEDESIEVERVPLHQVTDLIKQGVIKDAKSIAALLMAVYLFGLKI
jgi:ADP-ribose pyrophosphatase